MDSFYCICMFKSAECLSLSTYLAAHACLNLYSDLSWSLPLCCIYSYSACWRWWGGGAEGRPLSILCATIPEICGSWLFSLRLAGGWWNIVSVWVSCARLQCINVSMAGLPRSYPLLPTGPPPHLEQRLHQLCFLVLARCSAQYLVRGAGTQDFAWRFKIILRWSIG